MFAVRSQHQIARQEHLAACDINKVQRSVNMKKSNMSQESSEGGGKRVRERIKQKDVQ